MERGKEKRMKRLLTILIPTYNREEPLKKNLDALCDMIEKNAFEQKVIILVSNNSSTDGTRAMLDAYKRSSFGVLLQVFHQEENIGMSGNFHFILEMAQTPFVMYLGDDDYIHESYLKDVIEAIEDLPELTCMISSYKNILPDGKELDRGRDLGKKRKVFPKGFRNTYTNSWRGHQISGLVFRRDVISNAYQQYKLESLYIFLLGLVATTQAGTCVVAPEHPVLVTRPHQSQKAWNYGDDGLVIEIFEIYKIYNGYNAFLRGILQIKLLDAQYWRFAMYLKRGFGAFFRCVYCIMSSPNTITYVKVLTPFLIPVILIKKAITFLFTGKLIKTLKTPVDI